MPLFCFANRPDGLISRRNAIGNFPFTNGFLPVHLMVTRPYSMDYITIRTVPGMYAAKELPVAQKPQGGDADCGRN